MLCVLYCVLCILLNVCVSFVLNTFCNVLQVVCCVLRVMHVEKCVYFSCFNDISEIALGSSEFLEMGIVDFTQVLYAFLSTSKGRRRIQSRVKGRCA